MNVKSSLWLVLCVALVGLAVGCKKKEPAPQPAAAAPEFPWQIDQFADLRILRYQVPGFEALTPAQKELVYYLSEAATCGRDIIFDENYKYNLTIRHTLDAIVAGYKGDRTDPRWAEFMTYVKRVWFSNGIHHHYSNDKFVPGFDADYFAALVKGSEGASFPLAEGQSVDDLVAFLWPILFDPAVAPKKVSQDSTKDLVTNSAVNFYDGVTQAEVEAYYKGIVDAKDETPISYGLNTRVVKKDGQVVEEVAKIDGLYGPAIAKIVYWLEKAAGVAENDQQRKVIDALVAYYKSGDLEQFDAIQHPLGRGPGLARRLHQRLHRGLQRPAGPEGQLGVGRQLQGPGGDEAGRHRSRPMPSGSRTTRRSIPGSRRKRSRASRPRSSPRPCSAATATLRRRSASTCPTPTGSARITARSR